MYIIKNAFKSITRSKGRNILIGIIVLLISVSACIGLSIKQAAHRAKAQSLNNLQIAAQISVDREQIMQNFGRNQQNNRFDPSQFSRSFLETGSLSLEEMQKYADAKSVKSFVYTLTVSLSGSDNFYPIDIDRENANSEATTLPVFENDNWQRGRDSRRGSWGIQGDFTVIGYSSYEAMSDFKKGTSKITYGSMFEEGTSELDCIISDELALFNTISVGDTVTIANPNKADETYFIKVVGIYKNSQSTVTNGDSMRGFSLASDPANHLYMSYNALKSITTASLENSETNTDFGFEMSTAIPEQISGSYIFADIADYDAFEGQARTLGLEDMYMVSSADVTDFKQAIVPLDNISQMANYFLLVVLGFGALVLIVFNIFIVRERKYEVGVLAAIGMKKHKIALQFITEIFIVTLAAIFLGAGIGGVSSVPITNSLLKSQVELQAQNEQREQESIIRPPRGVGEDQDQDQNTIAPNTEEASAENYISQVASATDFTVLLQMLGVGILLTIVAGAASVIFIMRYEPLKILTNRD